MGYAAGNSQHSLSGMEGFYGHKDYSSMIVHGKIAKGTPMIVLKETPNGSLMSVKYTALNLTQIKRGISREDPQEVLDGSIWLVEKKHLNPLERTALR